MGNQFPSPEEVLSNGLSDEDTRELIDSIIKKLINRFKNENRGNSVKNAERVTINLSPNEALTFRRDTGLIKRAQEQVGPRWDLRIIPYTSYRTVERDDPGPTGSQVPVLPHASIGIPQGR